MESISFISRCHGIVHSQLQFVSVIALAIVKFSIINLFTLSFNHIRHYRFGVALDKDESNKSNCLYYYLISMQTIIDYKDTKKTKTFFTPITYTNKCINVVILSRFITLDVLANCLNSITFRCEFHALQLLWYSSTLIIQVAYWACTLWFYKHIWVIVYSAVTNSNPLYIYETFYFSLVQ